MSDKQIFSSSDRNNKKNNRIDSNQQAIKHKKVIKSNADVHNDNMSPCAFPLHYTYNNHRQSRNIKWSDKLTPHILSQGILHKYSLIPCDYDIHIVENLIESKNSHFIAVFKDHMIMDYVDEFLKRSYKIKESVERIPKFANYYKNYLQFFCKPMFSDFPVNDVIQVYGELTAKVYYNRNYGKQKKNKGKADISERLKNIFSQTIKEGIDNESSLRESSRHISQSISLAGNENEFFGNFNGKDGNLKMSYCEESLISLLDTFQPKKNGNGHASMRTTRTVDNFTTIHKDKIQKIPQGNNDKNNCKRGAETERMQTSKDINKEISYDLRTSLCNTNNTNQLSRNTVNKNGSLKNTHCGIHSNSRNKPIKLTTGQPMHMKTVSVQLNNQKKEKMLTKNNHKTQSQGKLSSDSIPSSGQIQGQSISQGQVQNQGNISNSNTISIPNPLLSPTTNHRKPHAATSRHITGSPGSNLNLNDVMQLTLQLYYPSSKKSQRTTNHNHQHQHSNSNNTKPSNPQHQHTLSSPRINNPLSLNKSPRQSRNPNISSNSNNKLTFNTINTNTINSHRKKESMQEELKRNINLNIDLKNIIKKNKTMSRNKPQSLIKTKTEIPIKGSNFLSPKGLIGASTNKLFTSFSIFDIQQQLLNSKGMIKGVNSKKSFPSRRNEDPLASIHQYQSFSQTQKIQKVNNGNGRLLHNVKSMNYNSNSINSKQRSDSRGQQQQQQQQHHHLQVKRSYKNYQ